MQPKMDSRFVESVYDTLQGEIDPCFAVPGVENAFQEGTECALLYKAVYDAERRLEQRLGVPPYDRDIEKIISSLLTIQKHLCFKMYYYGATFRK